MPARKPWMWKKYFLKWQFHARHRDSYTQFTNLHHHAIDPTKQFCSCRVSFGSVNWILDNSKAVSDRNLKSAHVNSNCTIHTATPDTKQTWLFCRVYCYVCEWKKSLKSVTIWQSYKQERDCLVHFARLANSPLNPKTVHQTITFLVVTLPNIHRF